MNKRRKMKKAVKEALSYKGRFSSDSHSSKTKLERKIDRAVERQVKKGYRHIVYTGDRFYSGDTELLSLIGIPYDRMDYTSVSHHTKTK